MKIFISILSALLCLQLSSFAQYPAPALIPQPVEMKIGKATDNFIIDNNSTQVFISDGSLKPSAEFFISFIKKYYLLNLTLTTTADPNRKNVINLIKDYPAQQNLNKVPGQELTKVSSAKVDIENPEQYSLEVLAKSVTIRSNAPAGAFYGIQTLIQLLPPSPKPLPLQVKAVSIKDYPRFAYRGMHLDVSRHFFDIIFVKKYIDFLAMHKLNYFHWHLTDDHGWRIEIKKHPRLTAIGAWRDGSIIGLYPGKGNDGIRHGGYYTQAEVKEVIKYAAERYINIIPEIEMPGHSMAVLAAYPELSTTPKQPKKVAETWGIFNKFNNVLLPSEQTFNFLEEVLTEVMALFPSPYIHIGGDECSKIWWKQSAFSQQLIKEKGLKDENGLQSYFIHRIEKFVNSKGKTIIGWDEILDGGLAPNAIVMSWRGEKGGIAAAKQKHKVIMTPENFMYFNHSQFLKDDSLTAARYLPLADVYNYEPIPTVLTPAEAKYIWGGQGNLWSEYITNPAKVEYMLFPRLDALSEVLWSPKPKRNFASFQERLKEQFRRYDMMGVNYSKRYLKP
ncbi:beta-N-acetylhexosaminidase [Pedobacter sp. PACM 27299]|uniref:beta-N-acetylhexosaminidase n=1 Tax=Pedobacter sp. PACM 27299 TaxID=1727164 RepID=UPI0007062786|nr:beta-N-acetylhexosaminidase [Pedobacter sp. PACM 27299]ALL07909.1 beta-N-acetylhexosaminidase [Pedobacter sp. PACM 27299]